jgi:hypothetical protein
MIPVDRFNWWRCISNGATKGPWYNVPHPDLAGAKYRVTRDVDETWGSIGELCYAEACDAVFIAAARTAVPELLDEVQRLEEELDRMREDAESSRTCLRSAISVIDRGMSRADGKTRVVYATTEPYDVYIGRRCLWHGLEESKWHSPFVVGRDGSQEDVVRKYRDYIWTRRDLLMDLRELKGKTLGCYPGESHGYLLAELADSWRG